MHKKKRFFLCSSSTDDRLIAFFFLLLQIYTHTHFQSCSQKSNGCVCVICMEWLIVFLFIYKIFCMIMKEEATKMSRERKQTRKTSIIMRYTIITIKIYSTESNLLSLRQCVWVRGREMWTSERLFEWNTLHFTTTHFFFCFRWSSIGFNL